jgi:predicted nucleotidyltransferase component of viral defense system
MTLPAYSPIRLHEDLDIFRGLVFSTAKATDYSPRLIEKDYYCTVLLEYLAAADPSLVFKGGTCLAKVHATFYRLSEDLDFSIPLPRDATRGERRRAAEKFKTAMASLPDRISVLQIVQPCKGANNSTQYAAVVAYQSLATGAADTIKIEAALREPLLTPAIVGAAQTLLLNPVTVQPLLKPVPVNCLSLREAYAEKFRAALSRREAAIRDFYDLDHAIRLLGLQAETAELIDLVRNKLRVPGNDAVDVSAARLDVLRRQVESQLRPVLREAEFGQFDLDRAFGIVAKMAEMVR